MLLVALRGIVTAHIGWIMSRCGSVLDVVASAAVQ
jgi:hypothetical protein